MQPMRAFILAVTFVAASVFSPGAAWGQIVPWDLFIDDLSDSQCDLVNAANAELVVLSDTGEMVLVSGADVILPGSFVDLDGFVFLDGIPAGLLDFATDEDGFRTLWWLSFTGRAIEVDDFTLDVSVSDLFPDDFVDVPCDACPFWDDPTVCEPESPPIVIRICGRDTEISVALTLFGLTGIRLLRRRIW